MSDKLKADEVASQGQLYNIAKSISNPKIRALFVFEYLSGGRVGELVKRCKKNQLEYRTIKGGEFLAIDRFYTEKNKRYDKRVLIIPIAHEGKFIDLTKEWINSLDDDAFIFPFNRVTAWRHIRKIIDKFKEEGIKGDPVIKAMVNGKMKRINKNRKKGYCHMNANHYLRHCRATHLVTIYGFDSMRLVKYMGWTDARPADTYVHLNVDDLADKMM